MFVACNWCKEYQRNETTVMCNMSSAPVAEMQADQQPSGMPHVWWQQCRLAVTCFNKVPLAGAYLRLLFAIHSLVSPIRGSLRRPLMPCSSP